MAISLSVKSDIEKTILRKLRAIKGSQLRYIVARSLTHTAKAVKTEIGKQIDSKISSPTAYTRQSLWVKSATKADLLARVNLKDFKRGGARFSHEQTLGHLFVHTSHQTRNPTGLERAMYGRGLLRRGEYLVPGSGAKIDGNGNMSRGQVRQIIAQLKMSTSRYDDATGSARSRRNRNRSGNVFWSDGKGGLGRGIFIRKGRGIQCLAAAINKPRYAVRIDMAKIAEREVKANFVRTLDHYTTEAMRTAR
jgi:hypothetical protein